MSKETTALARVEMPDAPIAKIDKLREAYHSLSDKVNLITPMQSPDYIPAMHSVSLRAVVLNSNADTGDVYHSPAFLKPNERALTKIAILKLLQAAGGTVVESRRIDDRRDHYVAEFRVVIEIPGIDGTRRRFESSKGVDYRDGSPQTAAFQPNQLKAARQFVPELAETKALLRAVRGALALKQKYTVDELNRPFVVPALVPDMDMSDPEIKRMVAQKALGLTGQLYGPAAGGPAPAQIGDGLERPEPGQAIEATVLNDEPDDFGDAPPPEPAPIPAEKMPILCGCACGDQKEITEQVAHLTIEKVGAPWCGACWPWGPKFAQKAHRDIGVMGMPLFKQMDGSAAIAANVEYLRLKAGKGVK